MDTDLAHFVAWLRSVLLEAGYDLDKRGAAQAFARAADTDTGQTSRALRAQVRPSIDYLRAWTAHLRSKGSPVTLGEMLVRAGWVAEGELPGPDTPMPSTEDDALIAAADALGIPPERRALFIETVRSVAKPFADGT